MDFSGTSDIGKQFKRAKFEILVSGRKGRLESALSRKEKKLTFYRYHFWVIAFHVELIVFNKICNVFCYSQIFVYF